MENKKLCPHCKMEVNPQASRCPHCQGKIFVMNPMRKFIYVGIGLISIIFFISLISSGSTDTTVVEPVRQSFDSLVKDRFDSIMEVSPEIQDIKCDSNCSIVYFNYKTIPSDLETVIRGNAATFSRFKNVNTGNGDVTIIARKSDQDILTCKASIVNGTGKVTECK